MRILRELLLILTPLVVAAVITLQASSERTTTPSVDLLSDSTAPNGAKAVYLWLETLGYRVERMEYRRFEPDRRTAVLLVLAPSDRPLKDELTTMRRWVEDGGTLIVAASPSSPLAQLPGIAPSVTDNAAAPILDEFGIELRPLPTPQAEAAPSQPLLLRPAVRQARVEARHFVAGSSRLVPYLGDPEHPVAASLEVGQGQLYVLASTYALCNRGLNQADNAALLLNWLPPPGEAGVVAFDEIHHGRSEARSLPYHLVREPWGWALLYALGVAFLYVVLDGRRFGRAVPSIVDTRRSAAEYVVSVADLLRRGGKSSWVARHYERRLRRQLAIACGLEATLDTALLATRLDNIGQVTGGVTGHDARQVLLELDDGANRGISEDRLVQLAAKADRIIKSCVGRR